MLRNTVVSLKRASGYQNRVMVYAHRRKNALYLPPSNAHVRSPLAHKDPEEYKNTWDPRSGVDWHNRLRRRNHYKHWPWAWWTDDPVRHHKDLTHRRTFSVSDKAQNEGFPEWNYYEMVGQDYKTPSHFPVHYVAPFIHLYTSKIWSVAEIEKYLSMVAKATKLNTIADVANSIGALRAWGKKDSGSTVPRGLLQHLELVALDIVLHNEKVNHRKELHEEKGILRTREMERYYMLPYLRGPAMPEKLTQPSGKYPYGRYTWMQDVPKFHPLQLPDRRFGRNCYPA